MVAFTATSPFEVSDFSGGKTDFVTGEDPRKYQEADNLLILKHGTKGKLFTRPGSELYDSTNYRIPSSQRINGIREFRDKLFYLSARKLYYVDVTWITLQGPTGNDLFTATSTVDTPVSWYEWNNHLFITNDDYPKTHKVYVDSLGATQLRTAGLPRPANAPTLTSNVAGAKSYLYRIIFRYEYTAGFLTFIDRGGYQEALVSGTDTNITLTNIPVLANGADDNYDTASSLLRVEIYRTVDGGVTFYLVNSVANGVTSYVDTLSDTSLQTNELMYTEGGVPENDPPPLCKYLHIMDDKGYYANIKEGSEINPSRILQSIPGDIDSVPETYFVDVQDEIKGISSLRSSPLVFCKDIIYRLDGAFDGVGQGFITADKISDTAGCVSHMSIVQTVMGVFWAGNDGFYYTDSYRVLKVSISLDETYQTLVSTSAKKLKIQGVYDSKKLRIWWTVQSPDGPTDNDKCFILDLNWGISPEMPFTTVSGGDNFSPTFLEFIGANLIRADRRGYTFIHRDTLFSDPTINTGAIPSLWGNSTIIYDYISTATNFGTSSARKFVPRVLIECSNETNLSLQPISINDLGRREDNLRPIRYRGNIIWGDPDIYWGDPNYIWGDSGIILNQRRFPAKALRCQYKQLRLTNAEVAILSSDIIGTADIDELTKFVTLTNTASYDWPTLSVDFFIAFESDGYDREYLITNRTNDVLTYSDPSNLSVSASNSKWVMRGKPKGEIMQLIGYSIDYMIFGRTVSLFRAGSTGEPS